MRIIRTYATARAGLAGNPSDIYHGRTISVPVADFRATCVLYDWPDVEIVSTADDASRFRSIAELADDVRLHGYYGGIRLVKATIRRFHDFCGENGIALEDHTFSVRYETTVPRQVGLAGSSAIITATLRALCAFFEVDIPLEVQPALILSVETRELGIGGGLQDRVVQAYRRPVFMDFSPEHLQRRMGLEVYPYEPLDAALFPPLYVAYRTDLSEPTERTHNAEVRQRYYRGDAKVVEVMGKLARLTSEVRRLLLDGRGDRIGPLLDQNFELRCEVFDVSEGNRELVRTAREVGCSAKLAGSGGAVIGTYPDERTFARLTRQMTALHCRVIQPRITDPGDPSHSEPSE